MQYKLFSTNSIWLPRTPEHFSLPVVVSQSSAHQPPLSSHDETVLSSKLLEDVALPPNALLGGNDAIFQACGVQQNVQLSSATPDQIKVSQQLKEKNGIMDQLGVATSKAAQDQILRMVSEESNGIIRDKRRMYNKEFQISLEDALKAASNDSHGFIVWLKTKPNEDVSTASSALFIQPRKVSPQSLIQKLEAKQREKDAKPKASTFITVHYNYVQLSEN